LTLPDVNTRKGKTLAFNESTGAVEAGPSTSDVQTVSATAADIATLADIEDGTNATNTIQTVAGISSNVSTVAGISSNVTTVAGISSNVTAVANDATDIGTVASNISSVNTNATNISAIQGASANASTATTKASEAAASQAAAASSASSASTSAATSTTKAAESATSASNASTSETNSAASATAAASSATAAAASQTAAAASAAAAANSYDQFDDRYHGSLSSNPSTDPDGNALAAGMLYFNNSANEMRVYDGANWIAATSAGNVSLILYEYTATAGQTTFSGSDDNSATLSYTVDNLQVVMNGIVLDPSDYTATNGTSVVLASGAALNDLVNIYAFKSFTVADTVSASAGGTFSANVAITGDLTVDTDTLHVDAANDAVGINTSPQSFSDLQVKTATDRHVAIFDNAAGPTVAGLTDAGASAQLRIAGQNIVFTGAGGSGTEHLRIQSGGGISFNGDTAAANALDDYEEGTYSPTVSGSTVAGTGTFSSLSGAYTKIGNRVFVSVLIAHSNTHTLTGAYQISLPFTSTSNGGGGFVSYKTGWVTNGPDMADIATGQALCYLRYDTNTAIGDIPGSYTQNGSTARVHIIYDAA
jgi:hypothetical protein